MFLGLFLPEMQLWSTSCPTAFRCLFVVGCLWKPEWGTGEWNEGNHGNAGNQDGNAENQGGNVGNRGGEYRGCGEWGGNAGNQDENAGNRIE